METGYREPYKDSYDHTPKVEENARNNIANYLQKEGSMGYHIGPTVFARKNSMAFVIGVAVLDPSQEHPKDLRFFVNSMEALSFVAKEEDLKQVGSHDIEIKEAGERVYIFEIKANDENKLPEIEGSFDFDNDIINLNN